MCTDRRNAPDLCAQIDNGDFESLSKLQALWKTGVLSIREDGGFYAIFLGKNKDDNVTALAFPYGFNSPPPSFMGASPIEPLGFELGEGRQVLGVGGREVRILYYADEGMLCDYCFENSITMDHTGTFALCQSPYRLSDERFGLYSEYQQPIVDDHITRTTLVWYPIAELVAGALCVLPKSSLAIQRSRDVISRAMGVQTHSTYYMSTYYTSSSVRYGEWNRVLLHGAFSTSPTINIETPNATICFAQWRVLSVACLKSPYIYFPLVVKALNDAWTMLDEGVCTWRKLERHILYNRVSTNFLEAWIDVPYKLEFELSLHARINPNMRWSCYDQGRFNVQALFYKKKDELAKLRMQEIRQQRREKKAIERNLRALHQKDAAIARLARGVATAAIANLPVWAEARATELQAVYRGHAPPARAESDAARQARVKWQRVEAAAAAAERQRLRAARAAERQRELDAEIAAADRDARKRRKARRKARLARRAARRAVVEAEERRERERVARNAEDALEKRRARQAKRAAVQLERAIQNEALQAARAASRDATRILRLRRRAARRTEAAPPLEEPTPEAAPVLPSSPCTGTTSYPSTAVGSVFECTVCFSDDAAIAALRECGHIFCMGCCAELRSCPKCGVAVWTKPLPVFL